MKSTKIKKCPECMGKGEVECITQEQSGFECGWDCPICGGSGTMICPRCHGEGYVDPDQDFSFGIY